MATSASELASKGEYLEAWRQLKDDYPTAYTAVAITPGVGSVVAGIDYAEAMDRGDQGDAALAAASVIPGVKLAKVASKLAPASLRLKSQMNAVEKAIAVPTKHADKIGKAMNVEQVGEYATKAKSAQAQEAQAFNDAWHEQPETARDE
jgi:hypothetical protein